MSGGGGGGVGAEQAVAAAGEEKRPTLQLEAIDLVRLPNAGRYFSAFFPFKSIDILIFDLLFLIYDEGKKADECNSC